MRGLIYPVVFLIAAIVIGVGFLILRPQSLWAPATAALSATTGKVHGKAGSLPRVHLPSQNRSRKSRAPRPQPLSSESEGSVTVTVIALLSPTLPSFRWHRRLSEA